MLRGVQISVRGVLRAAETREGSGELLAQLGFVSPLRFERKCGSIEPGALVERQRLERAIASANGQLRGAATIATLRQVVRQELGIRIRSLLQSFGKCVVQSS